MYYVTGAAVPDGIADVEWVSKVAVQLPLVTITLVIASIAYWRMEKNHKRCLEVIDSTNEKRVTDLKSSQELLNTAMQRESERLKGDLSATLKSFKDDIKDLSKSVKKLAEKLPG